MAGPFPDYDPEKGVDGNRFQWILEQSKIMRAQRQAAKVIERFTLADLEAMRKHDASIEAEDAERLKAIRAKYDQARSRATRKGARITIAKGGVTP